MDWFSGSTFDLTKDVATLVFLLNRIQFYCFLKVSPDVLIFTIT